MQSARQTAPRRTYAGIFLIAAATLLLQVTFTRIFSVSIWYHFAFLVVSVALFGFGASGVALSLLSNRARDRQRLGWTPVFFGLAALLAYGGTNLIPFSPFRILHAPIQILYFFLYDLFLTLPFFFAGTTVVLILRSFPARAGGLYAWDLVGAGVGSVLLFLALPYLGAAGSVLLASALGFAAAACLAAGKTQRRVWVLLCALHLPLCAVPDRLPDVRVDASKPLVTKVDELGGEVTFSAWNALSRIDVIEQAGADPMILIDGAAQTDIGPPRADSPSLRMDVSTLAYQIRESPAVVIIGSGGGKDVQSALALGARAVTAVEINPIIIDLVTGPYRDYTGAVFSDPRVTLVQDEGRSFMDRRAELSDIIQITLIDTWAAGVSGAYSLTENYLYTTEAFRAYLEHLTPEGLLSITRWPYEVPRLAALGRAALESLEVQEAWRHIAVLEKGIYTLFLMKRRPFTLEEARQLRAYAARFEVQLLHDPVAPGGQSFYDIYLGAADPSAIAARAPSAVDPVGDDSPFFFQMARWGNLEIQRLKGFTGRNFLEPLALPVGQIALVTALVLGVLLSALLLAIPVLARKLPATGRLRWLGYFFGLGLAYIIVEVVLIQRFALFLGHPTYSVTTVLFAILLFSGLGSAWSGARRGPIAVLARPLFIVLPVAILLLTFVVPPLTRALMGLPLAARLPLAIAMIAPVAFCMGMPFPIGIRAASGESRDHVAWAWAANGCASVIGSVCAVLGAMVWSFSVMLIAAGVIYVLALASLMRMRIALS